jgi:hypothetical protein
MAPKNPLSRVKAALTAHAAAGDPLAQLDAARALREAADDLEAAAIRAARKSGATWSAIGALYGLTKQGAQQRFRPLLEPAPPVVDPSPARSRKRGAGKG